ncbi:MAG: ATP-grasp domain-containing protein [Candidatus Zixiibacteriota bacterium]
MSDRRVLVVGTTPDYIAYIHECYPARALFLTDRSQPVGLAEPTPDEASEIVCNLLDADGVLGALHEHLDLRRQRLSGIACYDCEWLTLAAELAVHFGLPYSSVESVRLSRDKYLTKKTWAEHGVRCPRVALVHSAGQALRLSERFGGPVVLKPLPGSGSELTFRCHDVYDLAAAYRALTDGLAHRRESPLYRLSPEVSGKPVLGPSVLAEEFVEGREYSADFIIDGDNLVLIRVAKKLRSDALPFGTTMAYVVPARLPGWMNNDALTGTLREAAHALGLTHAICMVDFIISKGETVLLELTPRIGGDCLPPLIRKSCGLDTIGLALDFAEGRDTKIPSLRRWTELVGMRLFSQRSGLLASVSCENLSDDSRIREIFIKRMPGHEIITPPDDYDSWVLGHVVFEPEPGASLRKQCNEISEKISINVEQYHDQKFAWIPDESCRSAQSPGPAA